MEPSSELAAHPVGGVRGARRRPAPFRGGAREPPRGGHTLSAACEPDGRTHRPRREKQL